MEGIRVVIDEDDLTNIKAIIDGPEQTPYENGSFMIRLKFGAEYPQAPPKGFFLTKIFHPNVGKKGEICVNTLKRDWKETHGLSQILMVIKILY